MFNLAIECSATKASIALCRQDALLVERVLPPKRSTLEALAPLIKEVVAETSLTCISVTHGPGSFSGLRIGLATAAMLAMAWEIPVAPVDSLAAIAEQQRRSLSADGSEDSAIVIPGINAFRNQVFTAAWHWQRDTRWQRVAESQVADAAAWMDDPAGAIDGPLLRSAVAEARQIVVTGPALERYVPSASSNSQSGSVRKLITTPSSDWGPQAATVGALGWHLFEAGRAVSAGELAPNYLRASAAEEKRRQ